MGRTLGRALLVGGEFAVGLEVADDDTDGLLDNEGALVAVGDGVALGEGEAVSVEVDESVGAVINSRDASVGLWLGSDITALDEADERVLADANAVSDALDVAEGDALAVGVPIGRALAVADALGVRVALALALAVADDEAEAEAEGSTNGSRFATSSGSHSAGMPSAASSESVDANAGVVPTSDEMTATQDAAMTIRRTRATRALAPAITRKTSPRHS